jgi:lipoprotein-releasing system ATP-binding protein
MSDDATTADSMDSAGGGTTAPAVPTAAPALEGQARESSTIVLSARGLKKSYKVGPQTLEVLRGADIDVREGEILAILGSSGSGKSTFLHVLGLLDRADEGMILFEGRDRASLSARERATIRGEAVGFVFQFYHLLPELTALENVLLPTMILRRGAAWRAEKAAARARAAATLERVGLTSRSHHRPSQLSGGERQRVAIARALQNRPRVLLCDEPTGNLDGRTAADVRALLWDLNAVERQTLVIVTHDVSVAAKAHRVVHLIDGRVIEGSPSDPVPPVG